MHDSCLSHNPPSDDEQGGDLLDYFLSKYNALPQEEKDKWEAAAKEDGVNDDDLSPLLQYSTLPEFQQDNNIFNMMATNFSTPNTKYAAMNTGLTMPGIPENGLTMPAPPPVAQMTSIPAIAIQPPTTPHTSTASPSTPQSARTPLPSSPLDTSPPTQAIQQTPPSWYESRNRDGKPGKVNNYTNYIYQHGFMINKVQFAELEGKVYELLRPEELYKEQSYTYEMMDGHAKIIAALKEEFAFLTNPTIPGLWVQHALEALVKKAAAWMVRNEAKLDEKLSSKRKRTLTQEDDVGGAGGGSGSGIGGAGYAPSLGPAFGNDEKTEKNDEPAKKRGRKAKDSEDVEVKIEKDDDVEEIPTISARPTPKKGRKPKSTTTTPKKQKQNQAPNSIQIAEPILPYRLYRDCHFQITERDTNPPSIMMVPLLDLIPNDPVSGSPRHISIGSDLSVSSLRLFKMMEILQETMDLKMGDKVVYVLPGPGPQQPWVDVEISSDVQLRNAAICLRVPGSNSLWVDLVRGETKQAKETIIIEDKKEKTVTNVGKGYNGYVPVPVPGYNGYTSSPSTT